MNKALNPKITAVNTHEERRLVGYSLGIIARIRPVRRADLSQVNSALTHDIGNPETTADFDEVVRQVRPRKTTADAIDRIARGDAVQVELQGAVPAHRPFRIATQLQPAVADACHRVVDEFRRWRQFRGRMAVQR